MEEIFQALAADNKNCIINQSLATKFSGRDMIGTKLPGDNDLTIIGIVSDFHYSSLKDMIGSRDYYIQ